ncbi:MAG: tyrosine-type recombinase/integrase [Paracoccaceae bacterium]
MATINKLPSGRYRAQVRRQGVYRAQTFSRKIDAQAWAVEIERAIESGSSRGVMRPAAGMTLSDVVDAYTSQARLPKAAVLSLQQIARVIGHVGVRQLNTLHIQDWIRERQGMGLQTASILRPLGRLSTMLQWTRDVKSIDINPDIVLEARRRLVRHNSGHNRQRDRIPTGEELERLRAFFAHEYTGTVPMTAIMEFALASAMRIGEICRIAFEDVNWERQTVIIRDRKDPKKKVGNDQIVPLLPAAMAIVQARHNVTGGSGRVFPYRSVYVSDLWHKTVRRLKIEDLTFHDLRHAAITELFRKGLGIPEVALVSGHKSWRELKRYTQLTAGDVLDKFRALEQAGG